MFGATAYGKWAGGMDKFVALLMTTGFPLPEVTARGVAALEAGGALLLALGWGTRVIAILLAAEMAVVITRVVWVLGFLRYSLEFMLLIAGLSLALAGGGALSLGRGRLSR